MPDSATDDELDLGDDEEEAEELHDGDLYDRGNRLGTLPMRQVDSQVRMSAACAVAPATRLCSQPLHGVASPDASLDALLPHSCLLLTAWRTAPLT